MTTLEDIQKAHGPINPDGHKMTFSEMLDRMIRMRQADPQNPLWDSPVTDAYDITWSDITVEDVTDSCDGSCEHPQCIYAYDGPDGDYGFETGHNVVPGRPDLVDEGLHFAVILHQND